MARKKIVGKPGGLVEPGVKQYGFLKKAFKKIKKGAKKVFKSPLGKSSNVRSPGALGVPWGMLVEKAVLRGLDWF